MAETSFDEPRRGAPEESAHPTPVDVSAARPDPPPLRLAHLLLCIAVCSAYLTIVTLPQITDAIFAVKVATPEYRMTMRINAAAFAIIFSATLSVFILLVTWWRQGKRVWNHPGHWMAVWLVATWCFTHAMYIAERHHRLHGVPPALIRFWDSVRPLYLLEHLPLALLFIVLAVGWRGVADTKPWRLYFACTALVLLLSTARHWPPDVTAVLTPAYFVVTRWLERISWLLLVVAMVNDLRPGRLRRHWSHWPPACQPLLALGLRFLRF